MGRCYISESTRRAGLSLGQDSPSYVEREFARLLHWRGEPLTRMVAVATRSRDNRRQTFYRASDENRIARSQDYLLKPAGC